VQQPDFFTTLLAFCFFGETGMVSKSYSSDSESLQVPIAIRNGWIFGKAKLGGFASKTIRSLQYMGLFGLILNKCSGLLQGVTVKWIATTSSIGMKFAPKRPPEGT
jgi:hypothetical protein